MKPAKPDPKPQPKSNAPKPIGESAFYSIQKYGLYAYQIVRQGTDGTVNVGQSNVYGVVASDLVDMIFSDINEGQK